MASLPPGGKNKNVKDGGALAYAAKPRPRPTDTGYVYAFKGNNTYEFYRYNTITNAWVSRDSIPAFDRLCKKKAVKKGAALVVGRTARSMAPRATIPTNSGAMTRPNPRPALDPVERRPDRDQEP